MEADGRRTEDLEEVGKRRARDVVVLNVHGTGEVLFSEVTGEVSVSLCKEVERNAEESALNLETLRPLTVRHSIYEATHSYLDHIFPDE
jgi:hypothetical protein